FLAAERWIFCFKLQPEILRQSETPAKLQHQRGSILRIGGVVLFALICIVAIRSAKTSLREVAGVLLLTSAGGAYLLALLRHRRANHEYFPREMVLAVYISGATGLFLWAHAVFSPIKILLPALLFLLLLFYYLCLAAHWAKTLLPLAHGASLLETPLGGYCRTLPLAMIFAGATLSIAAPGFSGDPLLLSLGV